MGLQELQSKFQVVRIQNFLDKLEDAEIEWFWQAISNIHNVFPNLDVYLAGSVKGKGYIGFGVKANSTETVKDFLLVSHLKNNVNGNYFFKLEVIKALAEFILKHNPNFLVEYTYKHVTNQKFLDWLHDLKKYALEFGMSLNGTGLLPTDYEEDFSFTTDEAFEYLSKRYQQIKGENEKIIGFRNDIGRECALNLEKNNPSLFIGLDPEKNNIFKFNYLKTKTVTSGKYLEYERRHSGLEKNAPSLDKGHKAFYIGIDSLNDLDKFCNWYEQRGDQTTVLERKVKSFLELWPVERLKSLTVEEYHQAKNKDCFIAQIDSFDPTQGDPTFACYFDIWEPVGLGDNDKYHNAKPYSWNKRLGDDSEQAFQQIKQEILDIVAAVQRRDLNAIDQIQFTKGLKWMIAFLYQDFNDPFIIPIVSKVNTKRIGYDHLYPKLSLPEFMPRLLADQGDQEFFPYVEKLFAMVRKGYLDNKQKKQQPEQTENDVMTQQPLNRILFGAAGTGKTFHTINHALSIIENKTLESLEDEDRTALKKRFDEYKSQGKIKFVTFHQSFSYEDFVEGIRAETDEAGNLTYPVKAGVFKEICDKEQQILKALDALIEQARHKRIDIATKSGEKFQIGTNPNTGNLITIAVEGTGSEKALNKSVIINYLRDQTDYIIPNKNYEWAVARFLRPVVNKNYILIIDEINRGNISRIFGELITLIEDSKREGEEEALSVTLPYSKKEFSVPKNVYLIGTMNSSDRSLTGLDIALRRRFTFIEMPPKPELLDDISVDGLNIGELLKVINQRIEVLLDCDHCIGHANFMSLKEQPTLEYLASIFKQKIIPQLQEYFFDDWSKINMVLNANGMLKSKTVERSVLFPNVDTDSDGFFEEQKAWELVHTAFESIETFNKIIRH